MVRKPTLRNDPIALSVPVRIDSGVGVAEGRQPLRFGVCLPKGHVFEPLSGTLLDEQGRGSTVQVRPLASWGDGSVKWLLVDAMSPPLAPGTSQVQLRVSSATASQAGGSGVLVREVGGVFVVDTGVAQFRLDRRCLQPFSRVELNDRLVIAEPGCRTICTDAQGRSHEAETVEANVETAGPIRTTLCLVGHFRRLRGLRFQARISFFARSGLVRMDLTVHNPNRARHKGGLWDLGDAGSILFKDLTVGISPALGVGRETAWRAEARIPFEHIADRALEIYQDSSGGDNWQSPNHVNREGRVPCRFRGYRLRYGETEKYGLRASPTVLMLGRECAVGVAVPEFWQQFPKAIEAADGRLLIRLFPRQWDDVFELQGGERKTHTIWLCFGRGQEEVAESLDWVHQPARPYCPPEWYASSGAVPHLLPESADGDSRLKTLMREALEGHGGLLRGRDVIDEYGWRNFGDLWANHEEAYYDGPRPVISHYNNQFDVVYGAILQLMCSGDSRWFEVFDPLARHVMDIDIYHTELDKPNYSGGCFWQTDHYLSAHTATHRTYSRENAPASASSYGGGPSCEHNYATGLLHYYWMTGDADAREAVLGAARWVIDMDDGARTVLGLIDDGPTGWATCSQALDYQGPGRGSANSLNVLLDAYLLSENGEYLEKAEQIVRRCVHPADDIHRLDLLDAEPRWSYTMFLSALARYLDVKAERQALDEDYAYGRASLLHYAEWMAVNERPYLDRPEELEYPTETWAAQEFRKANVMLAATRHATGDLKAGLERRAAELAERAWNDLLAFPSRAVLRAVAIMMVEGLHDRYWRVSSPAPAPQVDLPAKVLASPPRPFCPQRARVRERVSSVRGIVTTGLRLVRPGSWRPILSAVHRYLAISRARHTNLQPITVK